MNEQSTQSAASRAHDEEATRLTGIALYTTPDNERPVSDISLVSDMQQGTDVALSPDQDEPELYEAERAIDTAAHERRRLMERRSDLQALVLPFADDKAKLSHSIRTLRRLHRVRGDLDRAINAAALNEWLGDLGMTRDRRRWTLAAALGCDLAVVDRFVRAGEPYLKQLVRIVKEAAEVPAPSATQQTRTKRAAKPNLRAATRATRFDANNWRAAIAALSVDEQGAFVRQLENDLVRDDAATQDRADRAARITMIPHSVLGQLDIAAKNNDEIRRMLARLSVAERDALVADMLQDAIDDAIAGEADQRAAARARLVPVQYHEVVQAFLEQNGRKSQRQRRCATTKAKTARIKSVAA